MSRSFRVNSQWRTLESRVFVRRRKPRFDIQGILSELNFTEPYFYAKLIIGGGETKQVELRFDDTSRFHDILKDYQDKLIGTKLKITRLKRVRSESPRDLLDTAVEERQLENMQTDDPEDRLVEWRRRFGMNILASESDCSEDEVTTDYRSTRRSKLRIIKFQCEKCGRNEFSAKKFEKHETSCTNIFMEEVFLNSSR